MKNEALIRAAEVAGSQARLAKRLEELTGRPIRQQHVWNWIHQIRLPAELVIPVEKAIAGAVTRSELRPDIYPPDEVA